LFFFYTFNRNLLSWLVVIKGVEWFVRNTPKNLHVHRLFIRPDELARMCERSGLRTEDLLGIRPTILSWAFWKMLLTGRVPGELTFQFTRSLKMSYTGMARKVGSGLETIQGT
jgi:2-polyprenyl-6-hydroxyphenyl methylase/3-demethylubiquinone-9 3-methyltransferase